MHLSLRFSAVAPAFCVALTACASSTVSSNHDGVTAPHAREVEPVPAYTFAGPSLAYLVLPAERLPDGQKANHKPYLLPSLTEDEEKELNTSLGNMPALSVYIPSSCHDRAHAVWMQLPQPLQGKLGKVWVLSESAYSSVFPGGLVLRRENMLPWRYHVAAIYRDHSGVLRVLDPAAGRWPGSVTITEWRDMIAPTPNSVFPPIEVVLPPELYLFYGHPREAVANNAAALNNGEFYSYTDQAKTGLDIPRALARDDAANSAQIGKCRALDDAKSDATGIQAILDCALSDSSSGCGLASAEHKKVASVARTECAELVTYYRLRLSFWSERLQPGSK